jgi:hypothetical protein
MAAPTVVETNVRTPSVSVKTRVEVAAQAVTVSVATPIIKAMMPPCPVELEEFYRNNAPEYRDGLKPLRTILINTEWSKIHEAHLGVYTVLGALFTEHMVWGRLNGEFVEIEQRGRSAGDGPRPISGHWYEGLCRCL